MAPPAYCLIVRTEILKHNKLSMIHQAICKILENPTNLGIQKGVTFVGDLKTKYWWDLDNAFC